MTTGRSWRGCRRGEAGVASLTHALACAAKSSAMGVFLASCLTVGRQDPFILLADKVGRIGGAEVVLLLAVLNETGVPSVIRDHSADASKAKPSPPKNAPLHVAVEPTHWCAT